MGAIIKYVFSDEVGFCPNNFDVDPYLDQYIGIQITFEKLVQPLQFVGASLSF